MIPDNTRKVLGSRLHQAYRCDPSKFYAISGNDLNELRVLAVRFGSRSTMQGLLRDADMMNQSVDTFLASVRAA